MKLRLLILPLGLVWATQADADMYKRVDADGTVTYSSTPIKGGKKVDLPPLQTVPAYKSGGSGSHKVNPSTQKARDDTRRKVLEEELAAEEKLLAEAQQKLQDAQNNPHMWHRTVVVGTDKEGRPITQEISGSNAGLQQAEVQAAQEQVDQHQKNVDAIKAELGRAQ